jgi:hypothetical protein
MAMQAYNPNTWEDGGERSQVQEQPELLRETLSQEKPKELK